METKTRLHPLLTAAAVSLTVFSAVGVAALTGVLPVSRGASEPAAASSAPLASQAAEKPIEHAVTLPAPATTAAKPKPRPVARTVAPRPPAPAPEAIRPAPPPGVGGVVEAVSQVEQKGENPIAGPVIGGIAGAVLGHQIGHGTGRTVATAVGAGAGILGGKVIEQKVRATRHWETTVRLDDGSTQTIRSEAQPAWHAGERVRVVDGRISKS